MASAPAVLSPDFSITIKIDLDGANRRFKLPLRDLAAHVFPAKVAQVLQVPADKSISLERWSDSAASFISLDPQLPATYKQLLRAAKAKQKLRFRGRTFAKSVLTPETAVKPATALQPAPAIKPATRPIAQPKVVPVAAPQAALQPVPVQPKHAQPAPAKETPVLEKPVEELTMAELLVRAGAMDANQMPKVPEREEFPVKKLLAQAGITNNAGVPGFQVCCNNCGRVASDAHFHCGICDHGDFDLCTECVSAGFLCKDERHWLLKRFVKGGAFVNSTTERVAPKPRAVPAVPAFPAVVAQPTAAPPKEEAVEPVAEPEIEEPKRTCNSCVRILPERLMINCKNCADFDLCMSCHADNSHGHHPGHTFAAIRDETALSAHAASLCAPGRNRRHDAICDGCDKTIYGVRHKCLDCPDFDFCSVCIESGRQSHKHRFVKVYEPLQYTAAPRTRHVGVYCNGPLCNTGRRGRAYIQGVRYKCAVCHDYDLCDNCEAHPLNEHNKSHPLIKFKTMVRDVSVTAITSDAPHAPPTVMGDRPLDLPLRQLRPRESVTVKEAEAAFEKPKTVPSSELTACFKSDAVVDGTRMAPRNVFSQIWTMQNPGPHTWPAGCSVKLIGGDHMLNLDEELPASTSEYTAARESNSTERPVAEGELMQFGVMLKAPSRPGRYISYWRVKAPDGTPFGHKLWCDIEVPGPEMRSPARKPVQQTLPIHPPKPTVESVADEEKPVEATKEVSSEKPSSPKAKDSAMVFPQLDKESPESSMIETSAPASEAAKDKDLDSVDFSETDEEDGFYTDEEYDILDASDEEILSAASTTA